MKPDKLRVTEIFYSIQGESTHAGRPCVFVRLSRCNLRCNWCDTEYSFKGGDKRSLDEILERVDSYGCKLVEITGGEPLLQPGVFPLMTQLCDRGYEVLVETSGSIDIEPVDDRVGVIMDLKAPGSGEVEKNRWENLAHLSDGDEVKIVLLDRGDFEWAVKVCRERDLFERGPVHFSPVHGELNAQTLANWILEERLPVRLNLQIHKYLGVE
ncbi:MAG: radical SAM protein [Persicimonas sp.]